MARSISSATSAFQESPLSPVDDVEDAVVQQKGSCVKHLGKCGTVYWDLQSSISCPVCDSEQIIELQGKALAYLSKKLDEMKGQ